MKERLSQKDSLLFLVNTEVFPEEGRSVVIHLFDDIPQNFNSSFHFVF